MTVRRNIGGTGCFLADAVDARRFVAHQSVTVGTDVGDADVIAPDDKNVRFLAGGWRG